MSSPTSFPPYPSPSLTQDDVVRYLVESHTNGYCQGVYQGEHAHIFILVLNDFHNMVFVNEQPGVWQVQYEKAERGRSSFLEMSCVPFPLPPWSSGR
jgi:hypothetical protein